MGIISDEIMRADIFEKALRTRATTLYRALFERRAALNKQKTQLLKSDFRYKATQAYMDTINVVKDNIKFLTNHINKVDTMLKKNNIDADMLEKIEIDYNKQQ